MPNQRANSLPDRIARAARPSMIPRIITIQPHVLRSLKTNVELAVYTCALEIARIPATKFQMPARPSMTVANVTHPSPWGSE
jgi:hypothetical protein